MQTVSVVIANHDTVAASGLADALRRHFRSVSVARSLDEVRSAIPRQRADLAVVDLETVSLSDVQQLRHEFDQTQVLCVHRIADEEMWTQALSAGAVDCLQSADVAGIMHAIGASTQVRSNAA